MTPRDISATSGARAIPAADPGAGMRAHREAIVAAMQRVLDRGRYILGDECAAFEREFTDWLGGGHAVGVASGTDALMLALRGAGVGPGDEVITVSHTATATAAAIELAGGVPVFADIDLETYTMDPEAAARAVTPRTRVLLPVHLYGHMAPIEPLMALAQERGLALVEDAAQAHGAAWRGRRAGTFGACASFSFYPTKNLPALGDGGLVVTRDAAAADHVRRLREYGWRDRYVSDEPGFNSRLDELQAAILRVRITGLDADNARRRDIAAHYLKALSDAAVTLPVERPEHTHVYHQFVIRHPRRDALREQLRERGVGTLVHYPVAVHQQPAYRDRARRAGSLERTERAAAEVVSLPIHPELTDAEVTRVADAVREAAAEALK